MLSAFFLPSFGTSRSLSGSFSITFSVSVPKVLTINFANFGPTPFISPLPRYFSIPSTSEGRVSCQEVTENCFPNFLFVVKFPSAVITLPTLIFEILPTTVTRFLYPFAFIFITLKPFSSSV